VVDAQEGPRPRLRGIHSYRSVGVAPLFPLPPSLRNGWAYSWSAIWTGGNERIVVEQAPVTSHCVQLRKICRSVLQAQTAASARPHAYLRGDAALVKVAHVQTAMAQTGAEDAKQLESVGVDGAAPGLIRPEVKPKQRSRRKHALQEDDDPSKRRCVSTACVACRYVLLTPRHGSAC
jgi:hypothetical protein